MPPNYLEFLRRYYFNWANVFLLILVILVLAKCFLDFQIYNQKTGDKESFESKVLVVDSQKTSFGQTQYTLWEGDSFWLASFKSKPIYLETGKEYQILGQKSYYSYEQTSGFDDENYNLSLGYLGEITILKATAKNLSCNLICQSIKLQNQLTYQISSGIEQNLCKSKLPITQSLINYGCNNYSALSISLLIGNTKTFSKEIYTNFKKLSLTHIIAISGFQVVVMISVLEFLLLQFSLAKKYRFWIIFVFLLFFIFLVGPQLPILETATLNCV
jgi:predicted membrane metal-binding protein